MINTIVLKVASPCNLACTYCYEYNHGDNSWKKKPKRISLTTIELLAKKIQFYIEDNKINSFNLVAHGGEPLLLGAKYMDEVYSVLNDNLDTKIVKLSMQTNATLINHKFTEIFKKYKIYLGISLDGDEEANQLRIDHKGKQTLQRTLKGISIVQEECSDLLSGILSVININSNPSNILKTFSEIKIKMVDFLLPFYTHDSLDINEKRKLQAMSKLWLDELFNVWINNESYHKFKIRIFEDAIQSIITKVPKTDWFGQNSISYLVMEADGTFDILDHLKVIGSNSSQLRSLNYTIFDKSISEAVNMATNKSEQFKIFNLPDSCSVCKWSTSCGGGYIPHRYSKEKNFNNSSFYCDTLYNIFENSQKFLQKNVGTK